MKYMQKFISGVLNATMRSALVKSSVMASAAPANFFFSYSSREKPLTTRSPRTFSSMDSFRASYFRNTRWKAGIALRLMSRNPSASNGMTTANVKASQPPMTVAMTTEKISISGLRTAVRISIMKAICTLATSVVIRVTSDEEENLSMLANVKVCTF